MTLLLDTSILIDIEKEKQSTIKQIDDLRKIHPHIPVISFITYFEMLEGILKRKEKHEGKELSFLNKFYCARSSKKTSEIAANLRVKYSSKGIQLPLADIFIAATAREHNLLLITKDAHFKDIEDINKIIL